LPVLRCPQNAGFQLSTEGSAGRRLGSVYWVMKWSCACVTPGNVVLIRYKSDHLVLS